MPRPRVSAAGGFAALAYTFKKGREAGGVYKLYKRMRSKNACKTCAYGMGGQRGGMVNEAGSFPEVCKKSLQAQAGDMQSPIMEAAGRLAFPIAWREGETHFRRIGWDEALDRVAADLLAAPREATFFCGSGRSSNEAAFVMQTLARAYGTANIHNGSYYCHHASADARRRCVHRHPPGNLAMYYPEMNAVVPRRVDPESGTPAFKSIVARLEPVRG